MAMENNIKWWNESIRLKAKNKRRNERRKLGIKIPKENTNNNEGESK